MKKKETADFNRATYWRLLKYTKPYKFRLIVGILSGFLIGGSLFGSFMMLPSLFSGVDFASGSDAGFDKDVEALCQAVEKAPTQDEKLAIVKEKLKPKKKRLKLKNIRTALKKCVKLSLKRLRVRQ